MENQKLLVYSPGEKSSSATSNTLYDVQKRKKDTVLHHETWDFRANTAQKKLAECDL